VMGRIRVPARLADRLNHGGFFEKWMIYSANSDRHIVSATGSCPAVFAADAAGTPGVSCDPVDD
jgi:hypothetical protein